MISKIHIGQIGYIDAGPVHGPNFHGSQVHIFGLGVARDPTLNQASASHSSFFPGNICLCTFPEHF